MSAANAAAMLWRDPPMVRTLFKFDGDLTEESGLIGPADWALAGYMDFPVSGTDQGIRIASSAGGAVGLKTNAFFQLDPGSGNFSIEALVRIDGYYGRFYPLISLTNTAYPNIKYELFINSDGVSQMYPAFSYPTSTTTAANMLTPVGTTVFGATQHIRLNRYGDIFYLFVNGILVANSPAISFRLPGGTYYLGIGNDFPPGVDALYGVVFWSRYVKNSALNGASNFIVPSEPVDLTLA